MPVPFPIPSRYVATTTEFNGGQGTVYLYEDTALQRNVAIKVYNAGHNLDEILGEIRVHQKARSNHVAQLYDVIISPTRDRLALIVEYIDGPDFVTPPTAFASREGAFRLLYQIAGGIADLHASTVIHRDIKPLNMKVDPEGVVKLFDFGISCLECDAATRSARGSSGFRAPELYQTSGLIRFTAAVDIYAFGVTALHLLAGTLPRELLRLPPAPTAGHSYFSAIPVLSNDLDVAALFDKTLEVNPANRPTAYELKTLLRHKLTFGRHIGYLAGEVPAPYTLNAANPVAHLNAQKWGMLTITYTGIDFVLSGSTAIIHVNGRLVTNGYVLPQSCVIVVGAGNGADRYFISFDSSHPEVVL